MSIQCREMDRPTPPTPPRPIDVEFAFSTVERSLSQLARLARPSRIFGEITDADGRTLDRAAHSVLARVAQSGPVRMTDLAHSMEIDISTASRHVRSLEERALLVRHGAPGDQRASLLELTAAGTEVLDRSRRSRIVGIKRRLSGWSNRDLRTFARLLERFADNLSGSSDGAAPSGVPKVEMSAKSGSLEHVSS